jgi:TPR repeat protein
LWEAVSLNRTGTGEAAEWIRSQASLHVYWYQRIGCNLAGSQLGKMYELGVGVPQDYAKAVACYRQMMDNSSYARLGVANLTAKGLGVRRDEETAIKLFRESAEREIAGVAFGIAMTYSLACIIRESGTPNSFFESGTKM